MWIKMCFILSKITIDYSQISAGNKISYVNFCKLVKITKKIIISSGFTSVSHKTNSSATHNCLLAFHKLLIFYLRCYKVNNFW